MMETCTTAQTQLFKNGSAITEDFTLVGYTLGDGTKIFYNQSGGAGSGNGSSPQSYVPANGVSHVSAIHLELAVLIALGIAVVI